MAEATPIEVIELPEFTRWLGRQRDRTAERSIRKRIARMRLGNFGDIRPVGGQVSELRVNVGQGYRVYFVRLRDVIVVLLCGGDKSTQTRDIARAKELVGTARELVDDRDSQAL